MPLGRGGHGQGTIGKVRVSTIKVCESTRLSLQQNLGRSTSGKSCALGSIERQHLAKGPTSFERLSPFR